MNDALRAFAETPDRTTRLSGDVSRFADERVCILQGLTWANVSGIDIAADDAEELVDEVRQRIPTDKHVSWWIGPSARPVDLYEQLQQLGLQAPSDRAGILHALVCTEMPPTPSTDVEVRPVETFEEHVLAHELMWEAFDSPAERRENERPHLQTTFAAATAAGVPRTFIAWLNGRPAGLGRSIYADAGVFLVAGGVAPWARGRGVYRALVRARFDDAARHGTPALTVTAMPDTSLPILLRLGFHEICRIRRLEQP